MQETFDISGKVDTSNPIYKFYENDMQKYLKKFDAKRVTDDQGVEWFEVPIKEEYGKKPVQAFQKAPISKTTASWTDKYFHSNYSDPPVAFPSEKTIKELSQFVPDKPVKIYR